MNISENAAYLKGLAEGLNITDSTAEGKIINKLLDLVADMAEKLEALDSANTELYGYVEEMAEDLISLEDDFYDVEEDCEDYSDLNDDELDDTDEDEYFEIECPSCGEKVCFTEDIDIDSMKCPACGEDISTVGLCDCDGDCEGCGGCSEE